jgi:stage III sporulation protein SpoIIIAA
MSEQINTKEIIEDLIKGSTQYSQHKEIVIDCLRRLAEDIPKLLREEEEQTSEWHGLTYYANELANSIKNLANYQLYKQEREYKNKLNEFKEVLQKL